MAENSNLNTNAFKEKKWGKQEDGEYIIDGFPFRGRRVFQKVIEGFKELMKKGLKSEINVIEFQVLIQGHREPD